MARFVSSRVALRGLQLPRNIVVNRTVLRSPLALTVLVLALPAGANAQISVSFGLRGGASADLNGTVSHTGQIEYVETDGDDSVEIALTGYAENNLVQNSFTETDTGLGARRTHYREETTAVGLALVASYLFGHGNGGAYFALGAGVGAFSADWRFESPTDASLGTPLPGDGSFTEDEGIVLGSVYAIGVGYRLTDHLDVRAQIPTLFVSGSGQRELKFMPALSLTAAVGL